MEKNKIYYLHKMIKKFTKIDAINKEIIVYDGLIEKLSDRQKMYLNKLKKLGYNLQQTMFEDGKNTKKS